MKTKILPFRRRLAAGVMLFAFASRALANPTGLSVSFGSALAQQIGSQLNVTAGNNAVLNWQSFNIAAGETTVWIGAVRRIGNQNLLPRVAALFEQRADQ